MGAGRRAARVDAVRRFNRFYTRQIGVLQEGLLQSPFSLAEARVLYEVAHRDRPAAAELGKDLGLDAGYLSRILRGLRRRGLVDRRPSEADGRRSLLGLTRNGRAAFATLDERSRTEIGALLDPLPPRDQDRLVEAMRAIEELLGGAPRPPPPICCGRISRATWAGSFTATACCTRRSMAGTRRSRGWWRRSWPGS